MTNTTTKRTVAEFFATPSILCQTFPRQTRWAVLEDGERVEHFPTREQAVARAADLDAVEADHAENPETDSD